MHSLVSRNLNRRFIQPKHLDW